MTKPRHIALALVLLAAVIAGATLLLQDVGEEGAPRVAALPPPSLGDPARDPLRFTEARGDDYARRAAAGLAHVLYAKTTAGISNAAQRVATYRDDIASAAREHDVDADTLEAIVLLESGGNAEAQASNDLAGAVGIAQILAETGTNLLGLRVDLAASRRIARRIERAGRRGQDARVARLRAQRRRYDERLDPRKALGAAARYLRIARDALVRDDLAVAAYHMGIGNLQSAIARFGEGEDVPYARLFFDSSPVRHEAAHDFLRSLGDDSSTYLWRVEAAREIMRLHRDDPDELGRRNALQLARNSAEVALHPPDDTDVFADPDELRDAYEQGQVSALPVAELRARGVRIDRRMGELAKRVDAEPELYRGLRPEAVTMLAYMGASVRALSDERRPLTLTSTVRDEDYQSKLAARNTEAVDEYSLHTTGWSFDIAREYGSRDQAMAFQFVLDRLTALNLIAWVREPGAIHVTVASDAARLLGA